MENRQVSLFLKCYEKNGLQWGQMKGQVMLITTKNKTLIVLFQPSEVSRGKWEVLGNRVGRVLSSISLTSR